MNETQLTFKCLQCGECCRRIISQVSFGLAGLSLLPSETHLFNQKYIYPLYGAGTRGHSRPRPKLVYMYQYAKNPCEHLTPNNTCKIYPNRPTVCQAFPAETTPIGTFLHRECTQIAKLLKEGETITSDMIKGLEKEIQASETFSQHIRKAIKQAGSPAWAFDLKTKKWKKLTEG